MPHWGFIGRHRDVALWGRESQKTIKATNWPIWRERRRRWWWQQRASRDWFLYVMFDRGSWTYLSKEQNNVAKVDKPLFWWQPWKQPTTITSSPFSICHHKNWFFPVAIISASLRGGPRLLFTRLAADKKLWSIDRNPQKSCWGFDRVGGAP